jgi:tRNA threonylcarbamoyladenosine biosynthesis protein TsaE
MKTFISKSPEATEKAGRILAAEIKKFPRKKSAWVIALTGDLGAGKTTFLKGLLASLGVRKRILSPTFVILKRYGSIYHIDAYRLNRAADIAGLDLKKIMSSPGNLVLIEWADKFKKILPAGAIKIKFSYGDNERERKIKIG